MNLRWSKTVQNRLRHGLCSPPMSHRQPILLRMQTTFLLLLLRSHFRNVEDDLQIKRKQISYFEYGGVVPQNRKGRNLRNQYDSLPRLVYAGLLWQKTILFAIIANWWIVWFFIKFCFCYLCSIMTSWIVKHDILLYNNQFVMRWDYENIKNIFLTLHLQWIFMIIPAE